MPLFLMGVQLFLAITSIFLYIKRLFAVYKAPSAFILKTIRVSALLLDTLQIWTVFLIYAFFMMLTFSGRMPVVS